MWWRRPSSSKRRTGGVRPPGRLTICGTPKAAHASKLRILVPLSLFTIFVVLYMQFKSVSTTLLVFLGVMVSWSGAFLLIWLYAQDWFLNFSIFGTNMRDLFQVHPINLSVAVWVGFLALFGISDDDGVVMGTYLNQTFDRRKPKTVAEIRVATIEGGKRRIRACLMTGSTTILALIPVLTATGRGSDIMVPMAIPSFGGMTIEILTMLIVPVLYCWIRKCACGRHSLRPPGRHLPYVSKHGPPAWWPSDRRTLAPMGSMKKVRRAVAIGGCPPCEGADEQTPMARLARISAGWQETNGSRQHVKGCA
jgi:hypothetical protein